MDDDLTDIRDHFYIGDFPKALALASALSPATDLGAAELAALMARCHLGQAAGESIKGMQHSENPGLR